MTNFTFVDIFGILRVLPFFAPIFLAPGYCLGRVSNVLSFRQRGAAEQWLLSMGISLVVMPITLNLLSRWFPLSVTVPLCCLLAGIAVGNLLVRWRRNKFSITFSMRRSTAAAIGLAILWAVICLVSLPDLQLGHRLYSTAAVADLGVRTAFVSSAMHGGAPPANPFFFPGSIVKLRYYYYWYVMTAVPGVAAGVQPRAALFASSIWSGWLLAAAAALFLKHFYGVRRHIRAASVAAMALVGVTGLDALYVLVLYLKYRIVLSDMEVWDTDQVTSWTNSLLWVPHHVAATSACMLGFVFLWHAGRKEHTRRQRILLAILAAMGFASAAGLSVYVTFAFALFLFAAALYWLITRRFNTVGLYLAVATLVLLLSAGYLHDLRATGAHAGDAAAGLEAATKQPPPLFATLGLRQLPPTLMPVLRHAVHDNKLANILLRPLFLVPILFIEFGFFFLVAVRQGRHDWRERSIHATADQATPSLRDSPDSRDSRWLSWLMLASGLWVALMMRSTVISNNDLSFRGVEVAQFILLVWGAAQITAAQITAAHPEVDVPTPPMKTPRFTRAARTPFRIGWLAGSLLFLGVISSAYQLVMLRFYLYGSDRYHWTNPVIPQSEFGDRFGAINQQLREAYATLDHVLPPSAKVQFGAAPKLNLQHLYYSRYQELEGIFPDCGADFGGSKAECFHLDARIAPIFGIAEPPPGPDRSASKVIYVHTLTTAAAVHSLCRDLGIDALVVTGEDPVWSDPNGWPHQMKPIFASDFVAAYTCR